MRSWIFRNRLRLRALYGPEPPSREPGEVAAGKGRAPARKPPVRIPATVERRGKHTILRTRA